MMGRPSWRVGATARRGGAGARPRVPMGRKTARNVCVPVEGQRAGHLLYLTDGETEEGCRCQAASAWRGRPGPAHALGPCGAHLAFPSPQPVCGQVSVDAPVWIEDSPELAPPPPQVPILHVWRLGLCAGM